jgi:hypothetical protein
MEKAKTTPMTKRGSKTGTAGKSPDSKNHKAMHPEREIVPDEPAERADILPTTHIDDDPESYRLT